MLAQRTRRALLWLAHKLVSVLVFVALTMAWVALLTVLFKVSGLRARFYGAEDLWIAVATIAFLVLMIPVFTVHGRIMKRSPWTKH